MAFQLVAEALKITRLTAAQKLVLLHLCDVANKDYGHEVWHSQVQISNYQGLGERTTRDALKELVKARLISVGNRAGERQGRNHYKVNLERLKTYAENDRAKAEEVIAERHQEDRDRKARSRIEREVRASLRVLPSPVDNRKSA